MAPQRLCRVAFGEAVGVQDQSQPSFLVEAAHRLPRAVT